MYEDLLSGVISIENACQTECLVTVKEKIEKLEYHEESESCTTLACMYGNGAVLKKNPQSRKIGSMDTTPRSTERNVALSGSIRSQFVHQICWLYRHKMSEVKDTHPDIHQKFESGYHVVR